MGEQAGEDARLPFEALRCGEQIASALVFAYPHAGPLMPRSPLGDNPSYARHQSSFIAR